MSYYSKYRKPKGSREKAAALNTPPPKPRRKRRLSKMTVARRQLPHLEDGTLRLLIGVCRLHPDIVDLLDPTSDDSRSSSDYMDTWLTAGFVPKKKKKN